MYISIEAICAYLLVFFRRVICIETVAQFALRLQVSEKTVIRAESGAGGAEELWVLNVGEQECLSLVEEELRSKGWVIGSKSFATFQEWFAASYHALNKGMEEKMWSIFLNYISHGVQNIVSLTNEEKKVSPPAKETPPATVKEPESVVVQETEPPIPAVTPAEALRSIRKEIGLTQKALAKRMGLNQTTVSEMERGVRAIPDGFLARVMGLSAK